MTNGELLALARTWRAQALECNADKAGIEAGAHGVTPEAPATAGGATAASAPAKPWWRFW